MGEVKDEGFDALTVRARRHVVRHSDGMTAIPSVRLLATAVYWQRC